MPAGDIETGRTAAAAGPGSQAKKGVAFASKWV